MAIVKEVYSSNRVNLIYQLLKNEADNGTPKEYDIKVDDLKVVSRTSDPERFHGHEDFVLSETKSIMINIYDGTSNRCTRYNLLLKEEEPTNQELSGIEKSMTAKMVQERKKWEYEQLKKEFEELKEKLDESEEYGETLSKRINQLEDEQNNRSTKITDTMIGLAGMYIANKPNALSGIPLIGELFSGDKTNKHLPPKNESRQENEDSKCSFVRQEKEKPKTFTGEISEDDLSDLKTALIPFFKPELIDKTGQIIQYLFMYNPLIDQTIKVLEQAVNKTEQTNKAA